MKLNEFAASKILDVTQSYLGTHIEEAFSQFYSKNLAFSAELGQKSVIYYQGHQ